MAATPRYSVGTWDPGAGAYTPRLLVPAFNLTLWELKRSLRLLRRQGYRAHRLRDPDGGHGDHDPFVSVRRTDGMTEAQILEAWKR